MKSWMGKLKREIATVLVVIFIFQLAIPSLTVGAGTGGFRGFNTIDLKEQGVGEPNEIFGSIDVAFGDTVSGDSFDMLSMRFDFSLLDETIEEMLVDYMADRILPPVEDYTSDEYDAILRTAAADGTIQVPSFTCTLNGGIIDARKVKAWLDAGNGNMCTDKGKGEKIATLTLDDSSPNPKFIVELEPVIYNRANIIANFHLSLNLLNRYEEGSKVSVGKGTGDVNGEITITGEGLPVATDSNYAITKTLNKSAEKEGALFTYEIRAKALENSSRLPRATQVNADVATTSTFTQEIVNDTDDTELSNDLFSVPTKSPIMEDERGIQASNSDLRGKYISDKLPDGLQLVDVEISWNGGSNFEPLEKWEAYYNPGTRYFMYPVDNQDDLDSVIKQCDLRLFTTISDELWKTYYADNVLKREFKNLATLYSNDQNKILTYSEPVETGIEWGRMLEKDGGQVDGSQEMIWTLTLDGHFSPGVQLYLTDHIADIENTHNYVWEDGKTTVNINGSSEMVTKIELTDADIQGIGLGKLQFDADKKTPSIETIEALLEKKGLSYNDGTHYAYEYKIGEKTHGILLLSIAKYENKKMSVTYPTTITAKADPDTGEFEATVANDVNAVWKWKSGEGPGEGPWGSVTVTKGTDVKAELAKKESGGWKESDDTIPWNFQINQTGKAMEWFHMEDTLPTGLVWKDLTGDLVITDTKGRQRTIFSVSWVDSWKGEENQNQYMVNPEHTKIRIHLTDVKAEEYYKFDLVSEITDEAFAKNGDLTFKNVATVSARIGGTLIKEKELDASQEVKHQLIKKEVVKFKEGTKDPYPYDYDKNRVQWKVTVNPKKLPIDGAVISDTLPKGTANAIFVDAKKGNGSGSIESNGDTTTITFADTKIQCKESSNAASDGRSQLKFTFADLTGGEKQIDETYELTFTTEVLEEHRRTIFKSKGEASLRNEVELTGKIGSADISNAKANAINTFPPQPILKAGVYKGLPDSGTNLAYISYDKDGNTITNQVAAAYVDWTVYINRTKADYTGVEISDQVENVFQLIPTTMVISTVTLDGNGGEKEGSEAPIYSNPNPKKPETNQGTDPLNLEINEEGFKFAIPDTYKNETIKMTFTTILVDDAAKADMKNQIGAKGNDWEDATDFVKADKAEDFQLDDYVTASGMIFLQIKKQSSALHGNDKEPVYLKDAEFTVQEMKLKGDDATDIASWVANTEEEPKTKKTNASGKVAFMFLKVDTLYHVTETEAPVGYQEADKSWYVVIRKNSQDTDFPKTSQDITDGEGGNCDVTIEKTASCIKTEIENTPGSSATAPNEFVIKKIGQNDQALSDVKFTLRYKGYSFDAMTDADGIACFSNLDPISNDPREYYTLVEQSYDGYKPGASYRVYVTAERGADKEDVFKIELKSADGNKTIAPMDGKYVIKNTPIQQSGSFTKVDQNGEALTRQAVTFDVMRQGDGGVVSGNDWTVDMNPAETETEYESYLPLPQVTTDSSGIVKLDNLYYGDYKLIEQQPSDPDNNLIETVAGPVYIRVRSNGMFAKDSTGAYSISLNSPVNFKVENKVKSASIQINKVAGDPVGDSGHTVTRPLEDIKFVVKKAGDDRVFLNLKTDASGNFVQNSDGTYPDAETTPVKGVALTVGSYTLEETSSLDGYQVYTTPIPFEITQANAGKVLTIGYDGKIHSIQEAAAKTNLKFYNVPDRGTLQLTKTDGNSAANLDGAVFLIYANRAGNEGKDPVGFVVQKNPEDPYVIAGGELLKKMRAEFPSVTLTETIDGVPAVSGNDTNGYGLIRRTEPYWLKEIRAPYGYKPYDVLISLSIRDSTNTITVDNNADHSRFQVEKMVEILGQDLKTGGRENGEGFVFKITGNDTAQGSQKPIQELHSLLIDGKSLASANNAEALPDGILVTTGADGKFELSGVPVGVYKVREIDGPNFEKYQTPAERTVTISQKKGSDGLEVLFDGRPTGESNPVLLIYNQWKRQNLTGIKRNQDGAALGGAVFGLYSEDGQIQHRTTVSSEKGEIRFETIPVGHYLLRELQAPEGYLIVRPEGWKVTISPEASEEVVIADSLINQVKRGSIEGQKMTGTREPLAGAIIGLFPESTTSFIEKNLYANKTAISGQDGFFVFEQVPYGTYRVAELKAPSGYWLNGTTSYKVTITEDGSLVNVGMKEERLTGVGTEPEAIVIINTKNGGGGDSGSGGTPTRPVDPTAPTNPGPGIPPTEPEAPTGSETPTQSGTQITPENPIQPTIPFDPENPLIDVPGLPPRVEIRNSNGNKFYDGAGSGVNIGGWDQGRYEVFLFDERNIPLGSLFLTIDENGTPLSFSLPKTGDQSLPYALLMTVLLGALGAMGLILYQRKKQQE